MNKNKPFTKDFLLVVIGQIISLFGNAILRFALPLHLLNVTGSAALFGIISACAIVPMILLFPIGGIIADRVNKRNIMVILDFSTSAITLIMTILLGKMSTAILILIIMILLYGIQGTYQPAVQASIPALIEPQYNMQANAVINLVSSLAAMIGPVIGGGLYAFFGIYPILFTSIGCFFLSAVMEIFIHIPFQKAEGKGNIFQIGLSDLGESIHFISKDQPYILKVSFIVAAINLLFSCLIIVGLPIIVTQFLGFEPAKGNQLYGYAEGVIAAGSLSGGLLAGVIGNKISAKFSPVILLICTATLIPIGLSLQFISASMVTYLITMVSCLVMMSCATLFSIQMMSYLQILTPPNLVGKVISCAMCIGTCAQPIGLLLFGGLFEWLKKTPYIPFYFSIVATGLLCILSRSVFEHMDEILKTFRKAA